MAELSVIAETDAPKRLSAGASASRRSQANYDGYLKSVKKGQVGKLLPESGETVRGVSSRVSRAVSRSGKSGEVWSADGAVYFKLS